MKVISKQPLVLTDTLNKFDVIVNVVGEVLQVRPVPSVMALSGALRPMKIFVLHLKRQVSSHVTRE